MASPRLVIAADQRLVPRLEEEHLDAVTTPAQRLERFHEVRQVLALPDVHSEGDLPDRPARLRAQLGEGRDERGGQIVHAEVAHVLEALDGEALAGSGEPGDDDEGDGRVGAHRRRHAHATGSMSPSPPSVLR